MLPLFDKVIFLEIFFQECFVLVYLDDILPVIQVTKTKLASVLGALVWSASLYCF